MLPGVSNEKNNLSKIITKESSYPLQYPKYVFVVYINAVIYICNKFGILLLCFSYDLSFGGGYLSCGKQV